MNAVQEKMKRREADLRASAGERALRATLGAMKGLVSVETSLGGLPFVVESGGSTFHIRAPWFKAISLGRAISGGSADAAHLAAQARRSKAGEEVALGLPAAAALGEAGISPSAAIGGGAHEAGHAIMDVAGKRGLGKARIERDIVPHIRQDVFKGRGYRSLPMWINLTADIRLEVLMGRRFPQLCGRFTDLAAWCWRGEAKSRPQMGVEFVIRDLGKGWGADNGSLAANISGYDPEKVELAEHLRPIWEELLIGDEMDPEKTCHLPVSVALRLLNAIFDLIGGDDDDDGDGPDGDGPDGDGPDGDGPDGDGPDGDGPDGDGPDGDGPDGDGPDGDGPDGDGPDGDGPSTPKAGKGKGKPNASNDDLDAEDTAPTSALNKEMGKALGDSGVWVRGARSYEDKALF